MIICKPDYLWNSYYEKIRDKKTRQLRTCRDEHTCSRKYNTKLLKSSWLSTRLLQGLRENPNMSLLGIRNRVHEQWNADIIRTKAFRARATAKDMVQGSFNEQFTRKHDYCHELLRSNEGSTKTYVVEVQDNDKEIERSIIPSFCRMYIFFKACLDSFKMCRPIIGVDGCFLKDYYGGDFGNCEQRS